MKEINGRDLKNIRFALKFVIKTIDDKVDASVDPIRTGIWRGWMVDTLRKLGVEYVKPEQPKKLNQPDATDTNQATK